MSVIRGNRRAWFQTAPHFSNATRRWLTVTHLLLDAMLIIASSSLAVIGREVLPFRDVSEVSQNVAPAAVVVPVIWLVCLAVFGAYNPSAPGVGTVEYQRILSGSLATMALMGVGAYLARYDLSRGYFVLLFACGIPVLLLGRFALRRMIRGARQRGVLTIPTLVAGSPGHVADLLRVLHRERWLGYEVRGLLLSRGPAPKEYAHLPVVGTPDHAPEVIRRSGASAVIFAEGSFNRGSEFSLLASELERDQIQVIIVPTLAGVSDDRLVTHPVAGIPLVFVEKPQADRAGGLSKRAFDLVGSALLLVFFTPLLAFAALAIKLEDGGPAIFRQVRVGRRGKLFTCYKLRSMSTDAEQLKAALLDDNESVGGVLFKIARDPRITKVGRFIRRYSIDELPQLFNVLRGDMSLIGPRPALPSEVAQYDRPERRRLDVRPGLTGLWQVSGRSDLAWDEAVRLDQYYVDNWSMVQDLNILLRTLAVVLRAQGAY